MLRTGTRQKQSIPHRTLSQSFTNGSVECTAFGTAANNFTFCKHGSGHCWPGSQEQGLCTLDIDASRQIWEFFRRYALPSTVESSAAVEELATIS